MSLQTTRVSYDIRCVIRSTLIIDGDNNDPGYGITVLGGNPDQPTNDEGKRFGSIVRDLVTRLMVENHLDKAHVEFGAIAYSIDWVRNESTVQNYVA